MNDKGNLKTLRSMVDGFFKNLKVFKEMLSNEDIDIKIDSLNNATEEIKKLSSQLKSKENERAEIQNMIDQKKAEGDKKDNEVTLHELPLDWDNSYDEDLRANVHFDNLEDGYIYCLNTLNKVDIEFISKVTGISCNEVISGLGNAIYQTLKRGTNAFTRAGKAVMNT